MSKKNQGLDERLTRKKRVQRIKTGLVFFVFTWMLAWMLISVTLIAKVHSLQAQIDTITENMIRSSQQVEQQENQTGKSNPVQKYETQTQTDDDGQKNGSAADTKDGTADTGNQLSVADTNDDENVRKVYLTFDDGPSANTAHILDILDQYQVKATFFVTGREDEAALNMYKEIVDRGNTIGMHSYSHKYSELYESTEAFEQDLALIQSRVQEAAGQECKLYRFPGGSSNLVSNTDMTEFIRILKQKGITYFDWNVACGDATSEPYTTEELVENVMKDVVKHHTSVVLMHDAENKPKTIEALPVIIEKLQQMDAQILPIDSNTTVIQHVAADSVED